MADMAMWFRSGGTPVLARPIRRQGFGVKVTLKEPFLHWKGIGAVTEKYLRNQ
jgi:hypothetical protein